MEVPELEGSKQTASHMSSPAAFVEGGVQDSCDEACSICLEEFGDSEPPTVTCCRHDFHLHCILEWCQRSSQCPMCWQSIRLKDAGSQELLEAVERERKLRAAPARNTAIFRHPTLGDFELRHLPVGASDDELEERIIQHLAAAAAMGRTHHMGRREGQRHRSSPHGRPHLLVFSTHPSPPSSGHFSSSLGLVEEENETAASPISNSPSRASVGHALLQQAARVPSVITDRRSPPHISPIPPSGRRATSLNFRTPDESQASHQNRAGPSDFQAFSESIKSRFNAVSMRYKESITKSTRGWKERFFSRNNSMPDMDSEGHRRMNAGIASVSRMMDHLGTSSSSRPNRDSVSIFSAGYPVAERTSHRDAETRRERNLNGSSPAHYSTGSAST